MNAATTHECPPSIQTILPHLQSSIELIVQACENLRICRALENPQKMALLQKSRDNIGGTLQHGLSTREFFDNHLGIFEIDPAQNKLLQTGLSELEYVMAQAKRLLGD